MAPVTTTSSASGSGTPRARRLEWSHLPPALRDAISAQCGSAVVETEPRPAGFTPGFAAVLVCADSSRHFVKAASLKAQRGSALSYRAEARLARSLSPEVPRPRLRWTLDDEELAWVALGFPDAGEPVSRPWTTATLPPALDALEGVAEAPLPLGLTTAAAEFAAWPGYYDHLLPRPHLAEARALADEALELIGGAALVHTEPRADNVVLWAGASAQLADWTWAVRGAPWLDTVLLLVEAYDDGLDVEAELASRRLTRDVPAGDVEAFLALMAGYWLKSGDDPVPAAAPHLRMHQRAWGEAAWAWLSERRGWE